ncbi:hypothetical protein [Rhodalgimonas zhirmunskyi]|uniref:Uncharacterized protein n=1 Tax=Rhodalgimonas zhirmunskyi TaxID=2964767 RepID=A0AAJ1U3F9_9RHOB|nr:hypothetical protein [Rhodoalgimonas zhirmunskyi]MDQ2093016.1 hypothetical protein [Rhodoalgimonas zhirmunskyi]
MALTEQHQTFSNRIQRIERDHGIGGALRGHKRKGGTREAVFHCGVDETISAEQMRAAMQQARGQGAAAKRSGPLDMLIGLPLSFAMGVIGVVLAWYGIFFYTGGGTASMLASDSMMAMGLVAGVAVAAVLLLRLLLSSSLTAHSLVQGLGVIAGVALLHNAVHLFPDHWAMIFSDGWVSQVRGLTQAHTILLPGLSIPIDTLL